MRHTLGVFYYISRYFIRITLGLGQNQVSEPVLWAPVEPTRMPHHVGVTEGHCMKWLSTKCWISREGGLIPSPLSEHRWFFFFFFFVFLSWSQPFLHISSLYQKDIEKGGKEESWWWTFQVWSSKQLASRWKAPSAEAPEAPEKSNPNFTYAGMGSALLLATEDQHKA